MNKKGLAQGALVLVALVLILLVYNESGSLVKLRKTCSDNGDYFACQLYIDVDGNYPEDSLFCTNINDGEIRFVNAVKAQGSAKYCTVNSYELVSCGGNYAGVKFNTRKGCIIDVKLYKNFNLPEPQQINQVPELQEKFQIYEVEDKVIVDNPEYNDFSKNFESNGYKSYDSMTFFERIIYIIKSLFGWL